MVLMPLWALLGLGGVAAYLLLEKSASAQESGGGGGGYQGTTLGPGGSSAPLGPAASTSSEDYSTMLGPGGSSTPLGSGAGMSGVPDAYTQMENAAQSQAAWELSSTAVSGYVGARAVARPQECPKEFCPELWAWIAYGSKPSGPPPGAFRDNYLDVRPPAGSWRLVTRLGAYGAIATTDAGPVHVALPVWVWYPSHAAVITPDVWGNGADVVNTTGRSMLHSDFGLSYVEMFPDYWVRQSEYFSHEPHPGLIDPNLGGSGTSPSPPGGGLGSPYPPSGGGDLWPPPSPPSPITSPIYPPYVAGDPIPSYCAPCEGTLCPPALPGSPCPPGYNLVLPPSPYGSPPVSAGAFYDPMSKRRY